MAPYLVVLSAHLLLDYETVIVAPLIRGRTTGDARSEPAIKVHEEPLTLALFDMFGVRSHELGETVASLVVDEDHVRSAIGRLFRLLTRCA